MIYFRCRIAFLLTFLFLCPFRWLLPASQFICRTPCVYSSFLRPYISHRVSPLIAQTSRRRAILSHTRAFLARFPRTQHTRTVGRRLENGCWTESRRLGRVGKRAPRRQTPGAGCPRLGTTTAMFVGRNGRKREPCQGMGVLTYHVHFRSTSDKYVPSQRKKGSPL